MNNRFIKAEENELRMIFENGKITKTILYYKDGDGLRTGMEEIKKRGLYEPDSVAEAMLGFIRDSN